MELTESKSQKLELQPVKAGSDALAVGGLYNVDYMLSASKGVANYHIPLDSISYKSRYYLATAYAESQPTVAVYSASMFNLAMGISVDLLRQIQKCLLFDAFNKSHPLVKELLEIFHLIKSIDSDKVHGSVENYLEYQQGILKPVIQQHISSGAFFRDCSLAQHIIGYLLQTQGSASEFIYKNETIKIHQLSDFGINSTFDHYISILIHNNPWMRLEYLKMRKNEDISGLYLTSDSTMNLSRLTTQLLYHFKNVEKICNDYLHSADLVSSMRWKLSFFRGWKIPTENFITYDHRLHAFDIPILMILSTTLLNLFGFTMLYATIYSTLVSVGYTVSSYMTWAFTARDSLMFTMVKWMRSKLDKVSMALEAYNMSQSMKKQLKLFFNFISSNAFIIATVAIIIVQVIHTTFRNRKIQNNQGRLPGQTEMRSAIIMLCVYIASFAGGYFKKNSNPLNTAREALSHISNSLFLFTAASGEKCYNASRGNRWCNALKSDNVEELCTKCTMSQCTAPLARDWSRTDILKNSNEYKKIFMKIASTRDDFADVFEIPFLKQMLQEHQDDDDVLDALVPMVYTRCEYIVPRSSAVESKELEETRIVYKQTPMTFTALSASRNDIKYLFKPSATDSDVKSNVVLLTSDLTRITSDDLTFNINDIPYYEVDLKTATLAENIMNQLNKVKHQLNGAAGSAKNKFVAAYTALNEDRGHSRTILGFLVVIAISIAVLYIRYGKQLRQKLFGSEEQINEDNSDKTIIPRVKRGEQVYQLCPRTAQGLDCLIENCICRIPLQVDEATGHSKHHRLAASSKRQTAFHTNTSQFVGTNEKSKRDSGKTHRAEKTDRNKTDKEDEDDTTIAQLKQNTIKIPLFLYNNEMLNAMSIDDWASVMSTIPEVTFVNPIPQSVMINGEMKIEYITKVVTNAGEAKSLMARGWFPQVRNSLQFSEIQKAFSRSKITHDPIYAYIEANTTDEKSAKQLKTMAAMVNKGSPINYCTIPPDVKIERNSPVQQLYYGYYTVKLKNEDVARFNMKDYVHNTSDRPGVLNAVELENRRIVGVLEDIFQEIKDNLGKTSNPYLNERTSDSSIDGYSTNINIQKDIFEALAKKYDLVDFFNSDPYSAKRPSFFLGDASTDSVKGIINKSKPVTPATYLMRELSDVNKKQVLESALTPTQPSTHITIAKIANIAGIYLYKDANNYLFMCNAFNTSSNGNAWVSAKHGFLHAGKYYMKIIIGTKSYMIECKPSFLPGDDQFRTKYALVLSSRNVRDDVPVGFDNIDLVRVIPDATQFNSMVNETNAHTLFAQGFFRIRVYEPRKFKKFIVYSFRDSFTEGGVQAGVHEFSADEIVDSLIPQAKGSDASKDLFLGINRVYRVSYRGNTYAGDSGSVVCAIDESGNELAIGVHLSGAAVATAVAVNQFITFSNITKLALFQTHTTYDRNHFLPAVLESLPHLKK